MISVESLPPVVVVKLVIFYWWNRTRNRLFRRIRLKKLSNAVK